MPRPADKRVTPVELLYVATATGGRALELINQVGNLEPPKSAYVTTRGAPQRRGPRRCWRPTKLLRRAWR